MLRLSSYSSFSESVPEKPRRGLGCLISMQMCLDGDVILEEWMSSKLDRLMALAILSKPGMAVARKSFEGLGFMMNYSSLVVFFWQCNTIV